jgi:hypothetical protein
MFKADLISKVRNVCFTIVRCFIHRQYSSDEHSSPLHNLVNELSHPSSGLTARLGYSVFTASQLVDWLMLQNRASIRLGCAQFFSNPPTNSSEFLC